MLVASAWIVALIIAALWIYGKIEPCPCKGGA